MSVSMFLHFQLLCFPGVQVDGQRANRITASGWTSRLIANPCLNPKQSNVLFCVQNCFDTNTPVQCGSIQNRTIAVLSLKCSIATIIRQYSIDIRISLFFIVAYEVFSCRNADIVCLHILSDTLTHGRISSQFFLQSFSRVTFSSDAWH